MAEKSSGSCCRCNKSGKCRNCACVKANRCCTNCLPGRLGHCGNAPATAPLTSHATATPPALTTILSPIVTDTPLVPPSTTCPPDPPLPQRQETLPSFKKSTEPTFVWGALNGTTFKDAITHCYEKVVHWKRNMIKVPSGKSGNLFVKELTGCFKPTFQIQHFNLWP